MRAILEDHGKPVCHDLLVAVGRLNAQLIELQELSRVGGAVVAWRQVGLELPWPDDTAYLGSEGMAARCSHGSRSWKWSLILALTRHHRKQHSVFMWWCWERRSMFLWPSDLLAAFLLHGLRRPRQAAGEATRETVQERP